MSNFGGVGNPIRAGFRTSWLVRWADFLRSLKVIIACIPPLLQVTLSVIYQHTRTSNHKVSVMCRLLCRTHMTYEQVFVLQPVVVSMLSQKATWPCVPTGHIFVSWEGASHLEAIKRKPKLCLLSSLQQAITPTACMC